jgi:hypothetical protein
MKICRGLYPVVALDGFQMSESADGQALFVLLTLINQGVDALGENSPRLQYYGKVALFHLLVEG